MSKLFLSVVGKKSCVDEAMVPAGLFSVLVGFLLFFFLQAYNVSSPLQKCSEDMLLNQ